MVRRDGASSLPLSIFSTCRTGPVLNYSPTMSEYHENVEISSVSHRSMAFLVPNNIFRLLKDGWSPREQAMIEKVSRDFYHCGMNSVSQQPDENDTDIVPNLWDEFCFTPAERKFRIHVPNFIKDWFIPIPTLQFSTRPSKRFKLLFIIGDKVRVKGNTWIGVSV